MDHAQLLELARAFVSAQLPPEEFLSRVAAGSVAAAGAAQIDLDRRRRCGWPEVIYAPGKSAETLQQACQALLSAGQPVLVTRVSPEQAAALGKQFERARYNEVARTVAIETPGGGAPPARASVAVVTAGATDLPVAEEAAETLRWMGVPVRRIADVGVAGPQRLALRLGELQGCGAVVVVAGMEGALPSVVGGHVDCPVVAVPTSVGYGANFGGLSALLSMLNSCAANVTVVNIDAGFKAGFVAGLIARRAEAGPAKRRPEN